jgi:transcription-repair coupling factor (superfamily II helicase)
VTVPIPRTTDSIGAPRIRDAELVAMVAGLIFALNGKPQAEIDMSKFGGSR